MQRFYFFAVCCNPDYIQQQCSEQRVVSRATLYHPISSQTDYWQVLSSLGSLPHPLVVVPVHGKKRKKGGENFPSLRRRFRQISRWLQAAFHAALLALPTQGGAWHHALPAMLCWQAALRCMYFIPPTMQLMFARRVHLGYGGRCEHALSSKPAPLIHGRFLARGMSL